MSTLLIECLADPRIKLGDHFTPPSNGFQDPVFHVNSLEDGLVTMLRKMPQTVVLHTDSTGQDLNDFFHLASTKGVRTIVICGSRDVFFGVMDNPDPLLKVKPVLRDNAVLDIVNAARDHEDLIRKGILPAKFIGMNVFELSHLAVTWKRNTRFVPVKDIVRAEFFGNETRFHLNNGRYLIGEKRLEHYGNVLSGNDFFMINGLDMINLNFVQRIVSGPESKVLLSTDTEIEMSWKEEGKLLNLLKTIEIG